MLISARVSSGAKLKRSGRGGAFPSLTMGWRTKLSVKLGFRRNAGPDKARLSISSSAPSQIHLGHRSSGPFTSSPIRVMAGCSVPDVPICVSAAVWMPSQFAAAGNGDAEHPNGQTQRV